MRAAADGLVYHSADLIPYLCRPLSGLLSPPGEAIDRHAYRIGTINFDSLI
jgi:hypothetical protein